MKKHKSAYDLLNLLTNGRAPTSMFHPAILARQAIQQIKGEPVQNYMELHEIFQAEAKAAIEEGPITGMEIAIDSENLTAEVRFVNREEDEDDSSDDGDNEGKDLPPEIRAFLDSAAEKIVEAAAEHLGGKNKKVDGNDFLS